MTTLSAFLRWSIITIITATIPIATTTERTEAAMTESLTFSGEDEVSFVEHLHWFVNTSVVSSLMDHFHCFSLALTADILHYNF